MGANVEEYFFRDTLKLWNNLPKSILSRDLEDFKSKMKSGFQPPKYKHFSKDQNWNEYFQTLNFQNTDVNIVMTILYLPNDVNFMSADV